jgi:hypothetical protein
LANFSPFGERNSTSEPAAVKLYSPPPFSDFPQAFFAPLNEIEPASGAIRTLTEPSSRPILVLRK